jgi:hypothetical protein
MKKFGLLALILSMGAFANPKRFHRWNCKGNFETQSKESEKHIDGFIEYSEESNAFSHLLYYYNGELTSGTNQKVSNGMQIDGFHTEDDYINGKTFSFKTKDGFFIYPNIQIIKYSEERKKFENGKIVQIPIVWLEKDEKAILDCTLSSHETSFFK